MKIQVYSERMGYCKIVIAGVTSLISNAEGEMSLLVSAAAESERINAAKLKFHLAAG
jgi:hypothetical protein